MSHSKALLGALTLSLALPITAQAAYWAPQVGADFKLWSIEPAEVWENLFPRIKEGYNIYLGTRINGFFGVDVGYEGSEHKRRIDVFSPGEVVFVFPELDGNQAKSDIRLDTVHIDVNFYWQVVHRVELIFMLGAAWIHPATHLFYYNAGNQTWSELSAESEAFWSGRFGFGVQYNPLPNWGVKALLSWDQTNRLTFHGADVIGEAFQIKPYHKATVFNIGIVYSFLDPRRHVPLPEKEEPFF